VARHMKVDLSKLQQYELDGVSFIGEISIDDPRVLVKGDELHVKWTSYKDQGKVKLYVAATDNFSKGGLNSLDNYQLLSEYNIAARKAAVPLPANLRNSKFLKVVMEGEHNTINRWIVKE